MELFVLPGPGHQGYLLTGSGIAAVVDPPLDTDAIVESIPTGVTLRAIIETQLPSHRIVGGRLLQEATGAPLLSPGGAGFGADPLMSGAPIEIFPEALVIGAEGYTADAVALAVDDVLLVGELDQQEWTGHRTVVDRVEATRTRLAAAHPGKAAHGSAGVRPIEELPSLPPPHFGREPLNAEAIDLTNRGQADLFWADPRYAAPTPGVAPEEFRRRLSGPRPPGVIDLRDGGSDIEGAQRIAPARLATEMANLAVDRQLVVVADDVDTARVAAGFLIRLGLKAAWTEP